MKSAAPRGLRLHIGIFGRRNAGKSTLLNVFTGQNVSIVSDLPGTTTDPVEKPMELLPVGPVVFIDTAGVDDSGALGELRIQKTRKILDRADLGVIVCAEEGWGIFEEDLLREFQARNTPALAVFNKIDQISPSPQAISRLTGLEVRTVQISAANGAGITEFKEALLDSVPAEYYENQEILSDIVGPGETAVLVVPIDKEAPRGRLIVPQVQTIRNLLDHDAYALVVKERGLKAALANLKAPPKLVVTDSQAFRQVAADTPAAVMMTSFSILFARLKGDLAAMASGARSIESLSAGDRVLIAEACTHHPIEDDIGRVKIPRWLKERAGGDLNFEYCRGHDFPEDLQGYRLVIHCGACMWNRKEVLSRIRRCQRAGVPITNYGLAIAYVLGIFDRALAPFADRTEAKGR